MATGLGRLKKIETAAWDCMTFYLNRLTLMREVSPKDGGVLRVRQYRSLSPLNDRKA